MGTSRPRSTGRQSATSPMWMGLPVMATSSSSRTTAATAAPKVSRRAPTAHPGYTVDVLNAVTTLQRYPDADRSRIGMWGHSLGGNVTLRALVIDPRIKVAVIWAGVTATYQDLLENWHPPPGSGPPPSTTRSWRQDWVARYGTPEQNPRFWNSISPMSYLADITVPIQVHHGTADVEVPLAFSQKLAQQLRADGKSRSEERRV